MTYLNIKWREPTFVYAFSVCLKSRSIHWFVYPLVFAFSCLSVHPSVGLFGARVFIWWFLVDSAICVRLFFSQLPRKTLFFIWDLLFLWKFTPPHSNKITWCKRGTKSFSSPLLPIIIPHRTNELLGVTWLPFPSHGVLAVSRPSGGYTNFKLNSVVRQFKKIYVFHSVAMLLLFVAVYFSHFEITDHV